MAVLVTGGAGYIGSHMVLALADAREDILVLDNLSTGFAWAIAPQAKLVEGDIGDEALVGKIIKDHKIDAIVHFAGSIVVPESVSDPLGLLSQQYGQIARTDGCCREGWREEFHLLIDGCRLWQSADHAGV